MIFVTSNNSIMLRLYLYTYLFSGLGVAGGGRDDPCLRKGRWNSTGVGESTGQGGPSLERTKKLCSDRKGWRFVLRWPHPQLGTPWSKVS